MAIPKRGSRKLIVDGVCYRWLIRHQPTYSEALCHSSMSVAVERVEPPSRCLLMLKADVPRPDNWLGHASAPVTPRQVAAAIQEALAHGWNPDGEGTPFTRPIHLTPTA